MMASRCVRLTRLGVRPLESWERQVLKELVSREQRRRYHSWRLMDQARRRLK